MQIWRSLDEVPADLGPTAVVIGNFDGVHLGHRHVLARAREVAGERGLQVVAVTFDPHPMAVLRPEHAPTTLTALDVRAALLHEAGADAVLALPFDREVAAWSPEEFVQRVLVDRAVIRRPAWRYVCPVLLGCLVVVLLGAVLVLLPHPAGPSAPAAPQPAPTSPAPAGPGAG